MSYHTRISNAFQGALRLPLYEQSNFVIFSDCHRGTGSSNDNFLRNELLYLAALHYYYQRGFTYLELGDGDELWENRSMDAIRTTHAQVFDLISLFSYDNRFFSVYGNHDIVRRYCHYPAIILEDHAHTKDIYLIHGHQAELFNSTLWPLARFLVRYLWRPLELLGVPDPTSASKNNSIRKRTEKRLTLWAKEHSHLLIAGHTHRPVMGTPESPYFNTGSCVSPFGITCIEIQHRCISLIKWTLTTGDNLSLYVARVPLGNQVCINDY